MPIPATPIEPAATAFEATYQEGRVDYLTPEISFAFDEQLLRKMRAVVVRQTSRVFLRFTIVGPDGNPVDLTDYGIVSGTGLEFLEAAQSSSSSSISSSSSAGLPDLASTAHVKVRFREAIIPTSTFEVTAAVIDASAGLVMCEVPLSLTTSGMVADTPGIYIAEAGIIDDNASLIYTDTLYVFVESSGWDISDASHKGPPSMDDLRLSIRDNDFFENELIENYGFGTVELCHAAIRAVRFWNDQPPPIARFSTTSFPFREIWMIGIQLFIFDMAEEWYRRNHFKQSAGGVTIDDMNRHREYKEAWKERFQRFKQLVMHRKASINMSRGYGSFTSGYNWFWSG